MSGDFSGLLTILKARPHFRRLWVSNIISQIGDWLSYIAVALISIEKGDGAVAVALVLVAHALPTALMSPITGPLADRFDRKKLIALGYVGAATLTVAMWIAARSGSVGWLQTILFLRVCVSGIAMTARSASIPSLVEPGELHTANALLSLTWSIMFTLGLALGGVASALFSPEGAILLDAFTFVAAAVVILSLPSLPPGHSSTDAPRPGLNGLIKAWRYARVRPRLLVALLGKSPAMAINGGAWIFLNLIAASRLAPMQMALALGLMQAARAIGTGIGPMLPTKYVPRSPLAGPIITFMGVSLFALTDNMVITFLALLLWGAGGGHNWVSSTVAIQGQTPQTLLGRMTATDFLFFGVVESISAVIAGILVDHFGAPIAAAWFGLGFGLVVYIGLVVYWNQFKSDDGEPDQVREG